MKMFPRRQRTLSNVTHLPPIADDEYWRTMSRWWEPSLSPAATAALLGVSTGAIRQYRAREQGFPNPVETGTRGGRWAPADIYGWIEAERPKARHLIPRIFHAGRGLQPAAFVTAETVTLTDAHSNSTPWVIHLWLPSDGKGLIAVAYGDHHTLESRDRAVELLTLLPRASAVAVVTDEVRRLFQASDIQGPSGFQAEVAIAERHLLGREEVIRTGLYDWFQLAALLRVNIPWWPAGLRRVEAIESWRPGAQPQSVRPYASWYDETILRDLVDGADPAGAHDCRATVEILNRAIDGEVYRGPSSEADVPGGVERPGIIQAARPFYRLTETPSPPTRYEMLTLLQLPVPSRQARAAACRLLHQRRAVSEFVSITIVTAADRGPLAQEWISRLVPVADPQCLGATFAERRLDALQGEAPRTWWADPENLACWVLQTPDGTFHATVGSRVPAAGRLTELELAADCKAAFFRAGGIVWPLPIRAMGGYYTCGYDGTGPSELIAATIALRESADSDLEQRQRIAEPEALAQLIHAHEPPLFVTEDELDTLLPL